MAENNAVSILKDAKLVKGGKEVDFASLIDGKKVIGLYFSAHWCPPCRGFTPQLAEWYKEQIKAQGEVLEIIFLSSDRDKASFEQYHSEMPWAAVPFESKEYKQKLSELFGVRGIPTLVFLKPNGEVVDKDGRQFVGSGKAVTQLF